jgi:hypothetical protein
MIDRKSASVAVLDEIRREVGAILTEMNQTTERNIELLEDRISRLQETLDQADRRVSILRRENSRQHSAEKVYSHLATPSVPVQPTGVPESASQGGGVESSGARPDRSEGPTASLEQQPDEMTQKERVMVLYRQGIPIERIASRVGTAVSEVELIVSLSERR